MVSAAEVPTDAEAAPAPAPCQDTAWHCQYCKRKLLDCVLMPGSWIAKLCPRCGKLNIKRG